jgi:S-DNA-T family DNA segregation ATPase FtsK/SpoIIIE
VATTSRPSTPRRPGGKAQAANKRTPAPPKRGAVTSAADAVRNHAADVWGLGLVALGLLCGLATYLHVAGPVGRGVDTGVGSGIGLMRIVAPIGLLAAGVFVLLDGKRDDDQRDGREPRHTVGRLIAGAGLLLLSVTGLLHVARGAPAFGDPVERFTRAGGYLGATVATPLRAALAGPGAALVLAAVGLIGLVVLTSTSVRAAADRTAATVKPAGPHLRRLWRSLFSMDTARDDDVLDLRAPLVYDQDADAPADGAPTRRSRAKAAPGIDVPGEDGPTEAHQLAIDLGPAAKGSMWKLPPLSLLERAGAVEVDKAGLEATGRELERALAAHGVETRLVGMVPGPTVTRYELELAPGVKVARVTSLHKDIAYAMATPDVRILAPIPGRQAIGVEVPNARRHLVALGDILASAEARQATHPLEVAIGRDINGKAVMANLATMPHVLIAGATGAGKSSCLNSLLMSILVRSTPEQMRMILVDPKRVEMGQYDRLPHLLTQVVTNPKRAANALAWAVREMERRYDLLAEVGVRDITGYNAAYDRGDLKGEPGTDREYPRLPFILVVIDELSDLMMVAARDVEDSICRIAQMARAVGIHLVIATQRPSVNVITGVIKANIPARLAFAVSSVTDSRVILDQAGAERLVGKGDLLLLGPASSVPRRVQGAWVSEDEVRKVVGFWRRQSPDVVYESDVQGPEDGPGFGSAGSAGSGEGDDEDLLEQAMELVVRSQLGSTSMLQRKLRVGFARAGRLMDLLEQRGVVGPSEGSKARAVLMTPDELDEALARKRAG